MQFIPQRDRGAVLRKVYDGMVEGGAFVVTEKLFANSARLQDILAFQYYDFKRRKFSAEEILLNRLRRQMHSGTSSNCTTRFAKPGLSRETFSVFGSDTCSSD